MWGVCVCMCVCVCVSVSALAAGSHVAPSIAVELCSNMTLNRVQAKAKQREEGRERKQVTLC
ncbi:hypothetical protein AN641_08125 [Candidatus Epulonipiscioides gigas]|nr:hypothetical protein AN641_08125 [Epulopiscium sp. SCG-C07WGA-EpuloA2]